MKKWLALKENIAHLFTYFVWHFLSCDRNYDYLWQRPHGQWSLNHFHILWRSFMVLFWHSEKVWWCFIKGCKSVTSINFSSSWNVHISLSQYLPKIVKVFIRSLIVSLYVTWFQSVLVIATCLTPCHFIHLFVVLDK